RWSRLVGPTMMTNDHLFDDFDGPDEIAAFVYSSEGKEGLIALLGLLIREHGVPSNALHQVADGLARGSLGEAAALIRQAAKDISTQAEIELATIMADDDPICRRAALARLYRDGVIALGDLADAGLPGGDLDYVAGTVRLARIRG